MLVPSGRPLDGAEVERAEALLRVGRLNGAAALARDIADHATPEHLRRRALIVLVESLRRAHALEADAIARLEASADEPDCPPAVRARALGVAALAWLHFPDSERGRDRGRRALAAAEEAGDPVGRCVALAALGKGLRLDPGRSAEGEGMLREAVELARASDDPLVHFIDALVSYAGALLDQGEITQAYELVSEQLRHAERLGLLPVQVMCLGVVAGALVFSGRWADAPPAVDAWWDLAVANDIHSESAAICAYVARLPHGQGDLDAAALWLERGERLAQAQHIIDPYAANLANERALLLEATHGPVEAQRHLAATMASLADIPAVRVRLGVTPVRLAVAAGDRETAHAAAAALDAVAASHGPRPVELPFLARLCGALIGGPVDHALAAFGGLDPHRVRNRVDLHLHQETLAGLLADAGRRDDAVRLLHDATDAWEEIGAPFFAGRTLARLRDLGVRRGARGRRARPATGWASLTPTERKVAELVAEGLTYQEIGERLYVSRRTVETHVGHIFDKLGVRSRRELSAAFVSTDQARPARVAR